MTAPSIPEQISVLEEQIASLRDSHTYEGRIDDAKARRDIEAMECTVALLKRWIE